MNLIKIILPIIALKLASLAEATTISGYVKDKHTLAPIVGSKVQLTSKGISTTTNSAGEFFLSGKDTQSNQSDTLIVSSDQYWDHEVPVGSSSIDIGLQAKKQRLVITTDIGGEDPDDLQSLVHAFLLSNEFDLEGIIYGHAWVESNMDRGKQRVEAAIDAYEAVFPNLKVHDSDYPTARGPEIESILSDRIFRLRKENPNEENETNNRTNHPNPSRQRGVECG